MPGPKRRERETTMICASCSQPIDATEGACPRCGGPVLLEGRYRLVEEVGHGAMGTTYRAERLGDGAIVAVKELPVRRVDAVKSMELFEREAAVLEQLDHPGVPSFVEHFVAGEGRARALFLVQEYIDGSTLDDRLDERRYDYREVARTADELCEILGYLHDRHPPVIHRDLKPPNIMCRADGGVVLIDFGSVRDAIDSGGGSTVAGTFGYMAPEQFKGIAVPATDVYGLGATMIAMLTRRDPGEMLDANNRLAWERHVDLPYGMVRLLQQLLYPDYRERTDDIDAIRRALARLLERPERDPWAEWSDGEPGVDEASAPVQLSSQQRERIEGAEQRLRRVRAGQNQRARERSSGSIPTLVKVAVPVLALLAIPFAFTVFSPGVSFAPKEGGEVRFGESGGAGSSAGGESYEIPGGMRIGMSLDEAAAASLGLSRSRRTDRGGGRYGHEMSLAGVTLRCVSRFTEGTGLRSTQCRHHDFASPSQARGYAAAVRELFADLYGEPAQGPVDSEGLRSGGGWSWEQGRMEVHIKVELESASPEVVVTFRD
jgi:DNA-directed RNA polymerase subunit RPC12/RpoP